MKLDIKARERLIEFKKQLDAYDVLPESMPIFRKEIKALKILLDEVF